MPEAGAPVMALPRVKPAAKAVSQVMAALKHSRNTAGPTMTDIVKFISNALHKPATKRQVVTALKRSVEFGILKRKRGHYLISSPEDGLPGLTSPDPIPARQSATTKKRRQPRVSVPVGRVKKRVGGTTRRGTTRRRKTGPRLRDVFRAQPSAVSSATTLADQDDGFDFYA